MANDDARRRNRPRPSPRGWGRSPRGGRTWTRAQDPRSYRGYWINEVHTVASADVPSLIDLSRVARIIHVGDE
jgi:hypothetical protein